jgi:hypothetical protein
MYSQLQLWKRGNVGILFIIYFILFNVSHWEDKDYLDMELAKTRNNIGQRYLRINILILFVTKFYPRNSPLTITIDRNLEMLNWQYISPDVSS